MRQTAISDEINKTDFKFSKDWDTNASLCDHDYQLLCASTQCNKISEEFSLDVLHKLQEGIQYFGKAYIKLIPNATRPKRTIVIIAHKGSSGDFTHDDWTIMNRDIFLIFNLH